MIETSLFTVDQNMKAIKFYILLLVLANIFLAIQKLSAQISPGDLSNAHAHLEGMGNCVKCHELGKSVLNEKCLECHSEMQVLIQQNKGYHVSTEVKGKNCYECHNEHHSRNFALVKFDSLKFDHQLSGFALKGKHGEIGCAICHKSKFIHQKVSQKTNGISYLGLGTDCLSCHDDYHQGTLGSACTNCHNHDAFKPAPGFDHQLTDYPLLGQHANVDCEKCHNKEMQNGILYQYFKGVKADKCTNCHTDVHEGKFGTDCLKCHNHDSFTHNVRLNNFNHDATRFPLKGMHQTLECNECHKEKYTAKLKYQHCSDCHNDYHNQQFSQLGKSPDCSTCHSTSGFTPSLYTIEQHNTSQFPLEGGHLATPCFACHLKTDHWEFRNIGKTCADCHEDIHEHLIEKRFYPDRNCTVCHNSATWNEVKFDHHLTSFDLEGKHATVSCRECHFIQNENGKTEQRFSALDKHCVQCHSDVHRQQFDHKGDNSCLLCHAFVNWDPVKFEHDSTRFKLDGGHAGVDCVACHKSINTGNESYTNYTFNEVKCALCHTP